MRDKRSKNMAQFLFVCYLLYKTKTNKDFYVVFIKELWVVDRFLLEPIVRVKKMEQRINYQYCFVHIVML